MENGLKLALPMVKQMISFLIMLNSLVPAAGGQDIRCDFRSIDDWVSRDQALRETISNALMTLPIMEQWLLYYGLFASYKGELPETKIVLQFLNLLSKPNTPVRIQNDIWILKLIKQLNSWVNGGAGLFGPEAYRAEVNKQNPLQNNQMTDMKAFMSLLALIIKHPNQAKHFIGMLRSLGFKYQHTFEKQGVLMSDPRVTTSSIWSAIIALDIFLSHYTSDGPAPKEEPWYFWTRLWPLFWPHHESYVKRTDSGKTTHDHVISKHHFMSNVNPNNLHLHFIEGDRYPAAFIKPTQWRLMHQHPELFTALINRIEHDHSHGHKILTVETKAMMYEALKILVTYTDLYPQDDAFFFFR